MTVVQSKVEVADQSGKTAWPHVGLSQGVYPTYLTTNFCYKRRSGKIIYLRSVAFGSPAD